MSMLHSDPTGDRVVRLEDDGETAPTSEEDLNPSATDPRGSQKTVKKNKSVERRERAGAAIARTAISAELRLAHASQQTCSS